MPWSFDALPLRIVRGDREPGQLPCGGVARGCVGLSGDGRIGDSRSRIRIGWQGSAKVYGAWPAGISVVPPSVHGVAPTDRSVADGRPGASVPPQARKLPPAEKGICSLSEVRPRRKGCRPGRSSIPSRNKYFQIEWLVYQLLQRWSSGTVEQLVAVTRRDTTSRIGAEDVEDLVRFYTRTTSRSNRPAGKSKTSSSRKRHAIMCGGSGSCIYLFIKIPLVRPHSFLQATPAHGGAVLYPMAAWVFGVIGAIGLFLVGQQWDTFSSTFLHFSTGREL